MVTRFAGVTVDTGIPCVLRDGTVLYADIYRPESDAEFPVLLMRQPYGKSIASTVTYAHPAWYARRGYMVIIQDVRGRGHSHGTFQPFVQEFEDGYDAVEWAAALPGSNGKVGMYGFSYQGYTQWAAAAMHPPHLLAIAPAMCAADLYHGWFYPHGRFALGGSLPWAAQLARDEARRRHLPQMEERMTSIMQNPSSYLHHLPLNDVPEELEELAPFYRDWVEHYQYDDYWKERDAIPRLLDHCVPAYHIGGWYDPYLQGTLQTFTALRQEMAETKKRHRLWIGPWAHIPWGRKTGLFDHGSIAASHVDIRMVQWFDHWLKEEASEDTHARVTYFELSRNRWVHAEEWPPTGGTSASWYIGSGDDPANGSLGSGRLSTTPPDAGEESIDIFVYDARLPMKCDSYAPVDRRAMQERNEILVYTSSPLQESVTVTGSPAVHVWVDVLNAPTDLVAILSVVRSDGTAEFLSIGRELLEGLTSTGTWIPVTMELRPLAITLMAGECIRLELTSTAYPLLNRHPNLLDEPRIPSATHEQLKIATIAITSSAQRASQLILPCRNLTEGQE